MDSNEDDGYSYKCKTTLRTEEKRVEWTIEHFSAVVDQRLCHVKCTFNAGESIGIHSSWSICLVYDPNENNKIKFLLLCTNDERPDDKISVKLDLCISYAAKVLFEATHSKRLFGCNNPSGCRWLSLIPDFTNDVASIRLKLTIYANEATNEEKPNQSEDIATLERESIRKTAEDMQHLLDSGYNSDFVVNVPSNPQRSKYESFKVHKNILAARSDVFKVLFETPMIESQSGEVTFDDLSPAGFKIFLKFIYTGTVDDAWKSCAEEIVDVADRFSISSLKEFVDMNLHVICNAENSVDLLQIARCHRLATAFKRISKYVHSNVHQIAKDL